ncbi:MAG: hypothetical protein KAV68_02735 [Dehalococcoidales bacterium]|nr:hypothetical protein [Dehalococcoidales bacterium]
MNNKKKCFVIMPVSKTKSCTEAEWTGIFEHMVKPAVTGSRLGFECERAKPRSGAFIKDILEGLNRSEVVIADLTNRNPNVCYELGIRHTLKNRTILIAQNIDDVPSDLQSYWVVVYKKDLTGASEFKKKVRDILKEMQKDPKKPDSPVADFLHLKNIDIIAYEKSENLQKLTALISELSYNITFIDNILNTVKESKELRKQDKNKFRVSNLRFCNACLELLLSTFYVKLPQNLLKDTKTTNDSIRTINARLDLWGNPVFTEDVEKRLKEDLPKFKEQLISALRRIDKIRIDYSNDNYLEPETPIILLSSPEHEEFLKAT